MISPTGRFTRREKRATRTAGMSVTVRPASHRSTKASATSQLLATSFGDTSARSIISRAQSKLCFPSAIVADLPRVDMVDAEELAALIVADLASIEQALEQVHH